MPTPICPSGSDVLAPTLKLPRPSGAGALPRIHHPIDEDTGAETTAFPRARGYEILSVVGRGGMGVVYEARHIELNRRAAIKTLRGDVLADPEFRARFRAEAEAIAKLQHPNIIQVFEVGTLEPLPGESHPGSFIALEFLDGGSLTQHARTPQAPRDAARVVETLARAAHAAHLLGVIHRDLKPSNVLLTREGEPKIADFGIAKQIEAEHTDASRDLTRAGTVMGTPEYMAPEQFDGTKATPTIDVYALGVILYELLTARVPFQGATFADTMVLARTQEPVPPRRLQPGVPRDLEVVCLKCLEKSPARRYESAEALAADLAHWAAGRPIVARPVGATERAVRWAGRNPAVAGLSAAVLLVAVTGVAGIVWNWRQASANAAKAEFAAGAAQEAAKNERWGRYRVNMVAASSALRLHDTNAARRALDDAPEEHRDWVWNLLYAQLDKSQHVLHGNPTNGGREFSPDGRWVLARGDDNAIRVWDTHTREQFDPVPSGAEAGRIALSPDGATFAYAAPDNTIVLTDTRTGRPRVVLRGHTMRAVWTEFGRDGSRLYSAASDNTLRAWDTATGKQLHILGGNGWVAGPLHLGSDEQVILTSALGRRDMVRLWDMKTGNLLADLPGHEDGFLTSRFNPTGDRLVTVEAFPSNVIRVWEVPSGKLLTTLRGHENQVNSVRFSPDGTRLASCSMDRTVRLWDVSPTAPGTQTKALTTFKGHTGSVHQCAFGPDGTRLVSASQDKTLRYWDVNSGDELAVLLGHTDEANGVSYTAGGTMIASGSADGTVRLWDVKTIESDYAIKGHEKYAYSVAFRPDGERIVSSAWDGTARIWDAATGRQVLVLDHGKDRIVPSVAFHPGGKMVATVARDNCVRLWDADTGQVLHRWTVPTDDWRDTRVAFSPRGDFLASGSHDGTVRMWDVRTRAEVAVFGKHIAAVRDVAFSHDGRYLASAGESGDNTVRVWDVDAKIAVQVLRGHTSTVYALAWNQQGTLLASGSIDGSVRLWDAETWREVGHLKHGIKVYGVAFTPDGRLLATACADNLIRIWDVRTQMEVAALRGHGDYVHGLAFSADGARLVSVSGDKTLRVWDARPPADRPRR